MSNSSDADTLAYYQREVARREQVVEDLRNRQASTGMVSDTRIGWAEKDRDSAQAHVDRLTNEIRNSSIPGN